MGVHRVLAELHPFYWSAGCDRISNLVRDDAVLVLAGRGGGFCLPQPYSVHRRELYRAAHRRKCSSMSPALVLFSVFFWSYLWGIFGAFIGVPATIAILTFCAAHPSSLWLAELFGSPSRDTPAVIHQPVAS